MFIGQGGFLLLLLCNLFTHASKARLNYSLEMQPFICFKSMLPNYLHVEKYLFTCK